MAVYNFTAFQNAHFFFKNLFFFEGRFYSSTTLKCKSFTNFLLQLLFICSALSLFSELSFVESFQSTTSTNLLLPPISCSSTVTSPSNSGVFISQKTIPGISPFGKSSHKILAARDKGISSQISPEEEMPLEDEEDEALDSSLSSGPFEFNNCGNVWLPQQRRPRKNRKNLTIRQIVQETVVRPANLIYPLFIHEEPHDEPIAVMPQQSVLSIKSLLKEIEECRNYGINAFMLFPRIPKDKRSKEGEESLNPDGLISVALQTVKEKFPDVFLCTDVALDPYTESGHDGIMEEETGKMLNDVTVHQLCKQALCQASAGADMVAPSDMMDGRIAAIRDTLEMEGFEDVSLMAYTAKYASSLYSPFREAIKTQKPSMLRKALDKRTYQMDISNAKEAELEAALDATEGADIMMVKPALPCLDIVNRLQRASQIPIAAYHVSGEYAVIKAAAEKKYIDEKAVVLECLKSIKRAGASLIATYFAKFVGRWISEDGHVSTPLFTQKCY